MNLILTRRSLFLPVLILSCACSSNETGNPSHGFRVFSEGGITIAENEGAPKYPGEIFRYEKELELRADPEVEGSLLLDPWQITRDRDGNIYVEDEGDMSIAMFDSGGRFLRRFGREGYGPGEFRDMDLPRISGDLLYVFDSQQNRITRFRQNGELVDVLPVPADQRFDLEYTNQIEAVIMAQDDRRIIIRQIMDRGGTKGTMGFEALVLDARNDTLWSAATPMMNSLFLTRYGTIVGNSLIPYGIIPSIACHSDFGIYISDGENPVLNRYTTGGNRNLEIRFRLEKEIVTAAERAAVYRAADESIAETSESGKGYYRARKEALIIADQKPCWTTVVIDDDGYVWLLRSETLQEVVEAGGSLFRVVSPEGEYLGDSRWPKRVSNASISHGCICFLVEEESGEMIPVIYRIRSNVDGLVYPQ